MNAIQLEYLKSILLSQLLLETNENLRLTKQYKQGLKYKINNLNKDLERIVLFEYTKVYMADPEMTTNILKSIEELIQKLTTCNIDELVIINAVIDKYKDNKDWFKKYGEAEFLRIE